MKTYAQFLKECRKLSASELRLKRREVEAKLADTTDANTITECTRHLTAINHCLDDHRSTATSASAAQDEDDERRLIDENARHSGTYGSADPHLVSAHLNRQLVESGFDTRHLASGQGAMEMSIGARPLAATLKRSAGFPPEYTRTGRVVDQERASLTLLDLVEVVESQGEWKFMRETKPARTSEADSTTAADAATARAEEADLAEAEFVWTEETVTLRSIGHFLPVTEEQLADVPGLERLIDSAMMRGVRIGLNKQLSAGNGTAPNVKGLTSFIDAGTLTAGEIARSTLSLGTYDTDAKKGKAVLTEIRQAATRVELRSGMPPTSVLIHPSVLEQIELLEDGDDRYLTVQPGGPGTDTLWKLRVATDQWGLNPFTTAGNNLAIVGDFSQENIVIPMRGDVRVEFGMNADDFKKLRQSVRGYVRASLALIRPRSFEAIQASS